MKNLYINTNYVLFSVFVFVFLAMGYITVTAQVAENPIEEVKEEVIIKPRVSSKIEALMASTSLDVSQASASIQNTEITKRLDSIIKLLSQINEKL